MERSSRILQHGIIKIWLKKIRNWILTCFFLSSKLNFDLCRRAEIIRVGLNMHLYVDIGDASSSLRGSTSSCLRFEQHELKQLQRVNIYYASPSSGEAYRDRRLTINFELWVEIFCVPTCFHMRIPNPCLSVCPHPKKRNHHSLVNISPTLVIDTSMERSLRVLHHGNPKIWFFFSKKFEIRILTFDEELKSP